MWNMPIDAGICIRIKDTIMVDEKLWIKSRSGNKTIRTTPYQGEQIQYLGDFEGWYRVFSLEHDIIAISEPGHAQGVFAYMIFGAEKVLLLDTGMGICNIKPVVERFLPMNKELIILNTHTHFDHIGSNKYFEKVYIFKHPIAIDRAENGYTHDEILPEITPEQFYFPYPEAYDHDTFSISGFNYEFVEENEEIDLGGRVLKVIYTPGHSRDSIMLWNKKNRLLFTGDTYYPGRLFLLNSDSQLDEYIKTMDKIIPYVKQVDRLIPSHNYPQDAPAILYTVRDAMKQLAAGEGPEGRRVDDLGEQYRAYDFQGCSIVLAVK